MRTVAVDQILNRLPERARLAYTALITHPDSRLDEMTGCSYAYITQMQLADEMGCSLRTTARAVSDLQEVGLAKVMAWAGATTEVAVRVTDIQVTSAFGPIQILIAAMPPGEIVDHAIHLLLRHWAAFDEELSQASQSE
jgi:hypothetical protein